MKLESKYEKYYNSIIREMINARMHLRLYKRLEEAREGYLKELNQAPGFFSFTIKAHLDAGLMHVFRVIKKQRSSITIWKFLDFVDSNLEPLFSRDAFSSRKGKDSFYEDRVTGYRAVTTEDVKNDREKLDEFKQVIENIITWRDKKGAHIDEKFALKQIDVSKDYPVTLKELEDITMVIADILNRYSAAYDSSTYAVDMPGDYGVQVVLDAIRLHLEERQKQLE